MPYSGMIFDFNGVLWWDTPLQARAWGQMALRLRGTALTSTEMEERIFGWTNRDGMEYLAGHPLADAEIQRLIEEKESFYRQLCLELGQEFRLSPGAEGLLDFLARNAIPRTIATASEKTNVDFFVRYLQLNRWFDPDAIVFDDGVRPGKPAPDIYLQAAANLGLAPSRCVVVEDAISGIRAARAAGIGHIIALVTNSTREKLSREEGVHETVENLGQVDRQRLFVDS
jgi:beta-phosphoglucomutase-like phosphatase (HAD superfamily)